MDPYDQCVGERGGRMIFANRWGETVPESLSPTVEEYTEQCKRYVGYLASQGETNPRLPNHMYPMVETAPTDPGEVSALLDQYRPVR
jgi:hypothetical protein